MTTILKLFWHISNVHFKSEYRTHQWEVEGGVILRILDEVREHVSVKAVCLLYPLGQTSEGIFQRTVHIVS